jgi:hypothetical protein
LGIDAEFTLDAKVKFHVKILNLRDKISLRGILPESIEKFGLSSKPKLPVRSDGAPFGL